MTNAVPQGRIACADAAGPGARALIARAYTGGRGTLAEQPGTGREPRPAHLRRVGPARLFCDAGAGGVCGATTPLPGGCAAVRRMQRNGGRRGNGIPAAAPAAAGQLARPPQSATRILWRAWRQRRRMISLAQRHTRAGHRTGRAYAARPTGRFYLPPLLSPVLLSRSGLPAGLQ